jgi:hypothetical protein
VSTPLSAGFKATVNDCPSTDAEKTDMEKVPCQSLISSLMYAMTCTHPNIAFAVGALCKFNANPGHHHWNKAKQIL